MRELYPPILPSYIPAFSYEEQYVNIYFALSHYNSYSQFSQVQLTIRYQGNNASALSDDYHTEIIGLDKNQVDDINAEYPYYVILEKSVLKKGFEPGAFYKVQIRLVSTEVTNPSSNPEVSEINDNLKNYSEWSTVCILKAIAPPSVYIKEFDSASVNSSGSTVSIEYSVTAGDAIFSGTYIYGNYSKPDTPNINIVESDETPSTWRMKLYIKQNDEYVLIGDSKEQIFNTYDYTNTSDNSIPFKYDFQVQLEQDKQYKFYYIVTTRNGYVLEKREGDKEGYEFTVKQAMHKLFEPSHFTAEINNDEAYIKVHIDNDTVGSYILTLRRSSSESNFKKWEDITNINVVNTIVNADFYDYAIKSGVVYRYGVQSRDNGYRRSALDTSEDFVMGDFEYAYLLGHNEGLIVNNDSSVITFPEVTQLKLIYDTSISSFSSTILESKVETLGSKYPFITRNGDVNYRTFPIAGLISYHMNETEEPGKGFGGFFTPPGYDPNDPSAPYYTEGSFTSRKELYGEESLDQINDNNLRREYLNKPIMATKDSYAAIADNPSVQYNSFYDYNYERDFREQVMDFLYDGKPKLFKSASEGNILIRLMDVSFTPKQELNRLVYEFSATAYEIDEPTLENLSKYDIQNIRPYEKIADEIFTYLGQLNYWDTGYTDNFSISNAIKNKHHIDTGETWNGMQYSNGELSYLKITFESAPYLIDTRTYTPYTYPNNKSLKEEYAIMGWLINYGTNTILVSFPNNIYEFKDENVRIDLNTPIIFPKKVDAMVDYLVRVQQKPVDAMKVAKSIEIKKCLGQLYDIFNPYNNFINIINMRYVEKTQKMDVLISGYEYLDIEADPGTVFYLQQGNALGELRRFVLNFTGRLLIKPDDSTIVYTRGYFVGKNITQKELDTYRDLGIITEFPNNPREFDYCTKENTKYIFYKKEWRILTPISNDVMSEVTYDIQCPVEAIVDYFIYKEEDIYE